MPYSDFTFRQLETVLQLRLEEAELYSAVNRLKSVSCSPRSWPKMCRLPCPFIPRRRVQNLLLLQSWLS